MLEQPQRPVQDQTGQPNPQTQVPQNPQQTELQGAVDQQILEGSNTGVIQVPGATESANEEQIEVVQQPAVEEGFFSNLQVGTGLLVATFVLAFTLILVLARLAQPGSAKRTSNVQPIPEPTADERFESTAKDTATRPEAAKQKQKSTKKMTRRQRRQNK